MAYANSNHLFTQPVRTYKANDPYYYEVDNIPIRQLEENVLWTKDQIDSLITPSGEGKGGPLFVGDDLDLENVKQFRPKWTGGRSITVQAGRFTGRVNDAYDIGDRLSNLIAEFPNSTGVQAGWGELNLLPLLVDGTGADFMEGVWDSFTKVIGDGVAAQQSYNVNGLDTLYTFYISGRDGRGTIGTDATTPYRVPQYEPGSFTTDRSYTWPIMWASDIKNFNPISRNNYDQANEIAMAITRFWRGVARTSVVDFRGESIEIPPFNALDYYYVTESQGIETLVSLEDTATQRIDLVVVYTHPIDSSASYIQEYDDATTTPLTVDEAPSPKKITGARLGIIRGAGIGIRRTDVGGTTGAAGTTTEKIELEERRLDSGKPKILANMNDHLNGTNTGLRLGSGNILQGSFPSPDDLLNLAPNLSLALGNNNLQLIGQTVLPVAYVIVTKGETNLSQTDIVDIRPFLRTTELAYNERAGIAAAEPPLSFANPAVGASQLEGKLDELGLIRTFTPAGGGPTVTTPLGVTRTVYHDYIMGGMLWGPEGVFLQMNESTNGPWYQSMPNRGNTGTLAPAGLTGWGALSHSERIDYLWALYKSQQQLVGNGVNYGSAGITQNLNLQAWLAAFGGVVGFYPGAGAGLAGDDNYLNCSPERAIPFFPEWQYQYTAGATAAGLSYTPYNQQANRLAEKWVWHLKTGRRYISAAYGGGNMTGCNNTTNGGTWQGLSQGTYPEGTGGPGNNSSQQRSDMRCLIKQFYVDLPPDATDYDVNVAYEGSIPDMYVDDDYWNNTGLGGGTASPARPTFTQGDGAQLSVSKSPVVYSSTTGKSCFFTIIAKYPMHSWGSNLDAQEFMPYTVTHWAEWQQATALCNTNNAAQYWGATDPDGIAARPNIRSGKCHYPTVKLKIQIYTGVGKQKGHLIAGANDGFGDLQANPVHGITSPAVAEGITQPPFSSEITGGGYGNFGQKNLDLSQQ